MRYTGEHLICPQSVLQEQYFIEIRDGLTAAGLGIVHVLLDADDEALRSGIEKSGEALRWRLDHIANYARARGWMTQAADLVVDVGSDSPGDAARMIEGELAATSTVE